MLRVLPHVGCTRGANIFYSYNQSLALKIFDKTSTLEFLNNSKPNNYTTRSLAMSLTIIHNTWQIWVPHQTRYNRIGGVESGPSFI
jgi:hypothetical protein